MVLEVEPDSSKEMSSECKKNTQTQKKDGPSLLPRLLESLGHCRLRIMRFKNIFQLWGPMRLSEIQPNIPRQLRHIPRKSEFVYVFFFSIRLRQDFKNKNPWHAKNSISSGISCCFIKQASGIYSGVRQEVMELCSCCLVSTWARQLRSYKNRLYASSSQARIFTRYLIILKEWLDQTEPWFLPWNKEVIIYRYLKYTISGMFDIEPQKKLCFHSFPSTRERSLMVYTTPETIGCQKMGHL